MAANTIESFFVALGFDIDTEKLDEFDKKIEEARNTVLSIGGVAAAAAGAIGLFVSKVAGGIDDLADFADIEQISVEALQEVGYAAQLSGSSLDAVKRSAADVNRTIGEAILGIGRGKMAFQQLGLAARNADGSVKTFDDLLGDLADRMQSMSRREAIAMAEKLGLDRSLIPLLMKGRDEFEKLRAEARAFGITTEEDAQKAGALADSIDRTTFMLGAMTKYIAVGLMPMVTAVVDGFREWLLSHQKIIQSGIGSALKVITAIIGTLWDWTVRIANAVAGLVTWLFDFKVVVYAAVAALTALVAVPLVLFVSSAIRLIGMLAVRLAALVATIGIVPIAIALIITAIGLLIDDLVNFAEGNESVFGGLVAKFPLLAAVVAAIKTAVGAFVAFWQRQWSILGDPVMDLIASVWNLATAILGTLWPVVVLVFQGIAMVIAPLMPLLGFLVRFFGVLLVGAIQLAVGLLAFFTRAVEFAFKGVAKLFDWFAEKLSGAVGTMWDLISTAASFFGADKEIKLAVSKSGDASADAIPTPARYTMATGGVIGSAGSNTNNTSTVSQTTEINAPITVNNPDPVAAAREVRKELEDMNRQATRNGQSAVAL